MGWCVEVQRDSDVCVRDIGNLVQAELVRDVGDLILSVDGLFDNLWRRRGPRRSRSVTQMRFVVQSLLQAAFEEFHNTMGVGVVMYWTTFSWIPDDDEKIGLAISLIHQIAGVVPRQVGKGIWLPVGFVRVVFFHEPYQIILVDIGRVDA